MKLISNMKLNRLKTQKYSSAYTNNLINVNKYRKLSKTLIPYIEKIKSSNICKKNKSKDENHYNDSFFIGGANDNDGGTIELLSQCFSENQTFQELINDINTQDFCNYVCSNLNLKPYTLVDHQKKITFSDIILKKRPCYLSLKLSGYQSGAGLAFHRDNRRKLVAMLFYLGFSDFLERDYGGTQLYSDKTNKQVFSRNNSDHIIDSSGLVLAHNHQPKGNSFIAFQVNDYSWHAVDKVNLEDGIYRLNLQINFMIPRKYTFLAGCLKKLINLLTNKSFRNLIYNF